MSSIANWTGKKQWFDPELKSLIRKPVCNTTYQRPSNSGGNNPDNNGSWMSIGISNNGSSSSTFSYILSSVIG